MAGYDWVRIKRVTENSKDVRGLDTKSLKEVNRRVYGSWYLFQPTPKSSPWVGYC